MFVAPFEQEGSTAVVPNLGRGFTRQVITGLTRFSNLFVYGAETAEMMGDQGASGKLAGKLDVDFVLSGSISLTPERFAVEVLLQERPEGRYVWTDRFEGELSPADLARTRDAVANEVVRKLAQPYGVLFSRCVDQEGNAPERLPSYRAVLDFYLYWRRFDRALYEPVRAALERAIADDPTFAEGQTDTLFVGVAIFLVASRAQGTRRPHRLVPPRPRERA